MLYVKWSSMSFLHTLSKSLNATNLTKATVDEGKMCSSDKGDHRCSRS